jgi:hypothetical protein
MTDQPEAARAAIGSLPPNQPTEGEAGQQTPEVGQSSDDAKLAAQFAPPETSTEAAEFGANLGAVDPLAIIHSIKSLVDLGDKVLGFVAKIPGPQQAEAQAVLKVLDSIDGLLNKLPL